MKAQLTSKYQMLIVTNQNKSAGFTLIELLVVISIIGILSAIATQSLFNYIPKAKQAEAKSTIASINSAQSHHWVIKSTFANNMAALGIGLPTSTANYTYQLVGTATLGTVKATPANSTLKGYAGAVEEYLNTSSLSVISAVICEAALPGNDAILPTSGKPGTGACGTDVELGQE